MNTGPAASGAALCMDKLAFGSVVAAAGLPSLPRKLVARGAEAPPWDGPHIVKPRFGGSSIGIEVIAEWADVVRYAELGGPHTARGVVAEPFRSDAYDVNVAVRTYPGPLPFRCSTARSGSPARARYFPTATSTSGATAS